MFRLFYILLVFFYLFFDCYNTDFVSVLKALCSIWEIWKQLRANLNLISKEASLAVLSQRTMRLHRSVELMPNKGTHGSLFFFLLMAQCSVKT